MLPPSGSCSNALRTLSDTARSLQHEELCDTYVTSRCYSIPNILRFWEIGREGDSESLNPSVVIFLSIVAHEVSTRCQYSPKARDKAVLCHTGGRKTISKLANVTYEVIAGWRDARSSESGSRWGTAGRKCLR